MSNDNQQMRPNQSGLVPRKSLPVPLASEPSRSLAVHLMEKVVPGRGRILFFIWLLALMAGLLILVSLQGKSTQFFGIAESREQSISFQYPVEIVQVDVVEGEQVGRHRKILEVRRYDLDSQLAIVHEGINENNLRRKQLSSAANAEIERLGAQSQAEIARFDTEIKSLEARYQQNLALVKSVSGDDFNASDIAVSPLSTEIEGLKKQRQQTRKILTSKIAELKKKLQADLSRNEAQVSEMEKRETELNRQAETLIVKAEFSGGIGSLLYKPGEQVAAFEPIVSLHASNTEFIKGYIHEAVVSDIEVGQSVWVKSMGAAENAGLVRGTIESLGSRIVEYPQRLKKNPLVSAWGREAVVRLSQQNGLLLGEKVVVLLDKPEPFLAPVMAMLENWLPLRTGLAAESENPGQFRQQLTPLEYEDFNIEASGVVWDERTGSFLLVSDEAIDGETLVFRTDKKGQILGTLAIADKEDIDDLESISVDADYTYLLTSLSPKRNKKLKRPRKQFVRMQYVNGEIVAKETVNLYKVLKKISKDKTIDKTSRNFLAKRIDKKKLEIEAHAVKEETLYLGFKQPDKDNGDITVLRVSSIDQIYSGTYGDAKIWKIFRLIEPDSGEKTFLTDMTFSADQLYLLSVSEKIESENQVSHLWRYDLMTEKLNHLMAFPNLVAEGISIMDQHANIVFDGSSDGSSYFLKVKI